MTIPGESLNARSWLFAPGDSERKMEKATAGTADIVILDLEDAVAEAEKPRARSMVATFLAANAKHRARLCPGSRCQPVILPKCELVNFTASPAAVSVTELLAASVLYRI